MAILAAGGDTRAPGGSVKMRPPPGQHRFKTVGSNSPGRGDESEVFQTRGYSAVRARRKGAQGVMRERKVMLKMGTTGRGFSQRKWKRTMSVPA